MGPFGNLEGRGRLGGIQEKPQDQGVYDYITFSLTWREALHLLPRGAWIAQREQKSREGKAPVWNQTAKNIWATDL